MVAAFLITLLVTLGAASLTYLWDRAASLPVRLSVGLAAGTTLLGLVGYALASVAGLNPVTVWLPAVLLALPVLLFLSPDYRKRLRADVRRARPRFRSPAHRMYALTWTLGALALVVFLWGAMYDQNGGLWTTNHYNHGDLPWHLAIVQGFAVGANFPPQHPEFAGARLTYPFLVDFVAAQYVAVGAGLSDAFRLQNLTLALALLTLLHGLALTVTRSRYATLIAPVLTLFNGGWGWVLLGKVSQETERFPWEVLQRLPFDVTRNDEENLKWGTLFTVLIGTQRGFLMALPLAFAVFALLWRGFRRDDRERWGLMVGAGLLAGIVPLVHGHTFLVLLLTGATLACFDIPRARERWHGWLLYFGIAGLLALPQVAVLASDSAINKAAFFGLEAGWDSGAKSFWEWCAFWYRNTGPLFPLLALALLWQGGKRWQPISVRLKQFLIPFALCFVLGNVVRLAPWVWDNMKVLYYFQVGACLLIAVLLARINGRGVFGKVLAGTLVVLCCLAGGIDAYRMASGQTAAEVFDQEGMEFARKVVAGTPPKSRILHAPLHTHPVLLSGRPVLHGFGGHLWSHGFQAEVYNGRMADIRAVYAGDEGSEDALRRLRADYLVVGPPERAEAEFQINDTYLSRFPVVVESGRYRLLRIPAPSPP